VLGGRHVSLFAQPTLRSRERGTRASPSINAYSSTSRRLERRGPRPAWAG
jgi:hypothetical protein